MSAISKPLRPQGGVEGILWYGLAVLVLGGGAGVWLPFFMPGKSVGADGFATYIFAVLVPLLADAVLIETYLKKVSKTSRIRLLFFSILAGFLAVIALVRDGKSGDLSAGITGAILSLIVWFLMMRYSGRFDPPVKKTATGSLGGETISASTLGGNGLPQGAQQ